MKKLALRVLSGLELGAAVLFLLLAALVGTMLATGMLNGQSARDVWAVLRGEKRAVDERDYVRWQEMEEKARTQTKVQAQELSGADAAYKAFQREQERRTRQLDKEVEILNLVNDMIEGRKQGLDAERLTLKQNRDEFQKKLAAEKKKQEDLRLKKTLQILGGMDTERIAEDFQKMWAGKDPAEKEKVVDLLRRMPARQSSEVINAIEDSDTRIAILKQIRA